MGLISEEKKKKKQIHPPVVIPQQVKNRSFDQGVWVHEFSFTDVFNNINHGYRAAILPL